jgi:hypothetical protein
MEIKKININDLNYAKYNPRKDLQPDDEEFQHIKNSIQNFGYIEPIIVNQRNLTIVGGHQRTKVLKDLGFDLIECVLVDLDEQQEKAANIALNSASGKWDLDKLKDLLNDIDEFDMNDFGDFTRLQDELDELEIPNPYEDEEGEGDKTTNKYIKIDKYEIPLTTDEYDDILEKIKAYLDDNGVLFGFYSHLLKGGN